MKKTPAQRQADAALRATARTARARALPGLIAENNKRLAAIGACAEGDWSAIDEACSWLAQNLAPDCQPDWSAHPLATRRYDRLKYRRKDT